MPQVFNNRQLPDYVIAKSEFAGVIDENCRSFRKQKQYLDLLLLADEQEDMVDRYLYKGKMYVLDDDGVKCECVVTDEGLEYLKLRISLQFPISAKRLCQSTD